MTLTMHQLVDEYRLNVKLTIFDDIWLIVAQECHQRYWSSLVQKMTCCLTDTLPFPEPTVQRLSATHLNKCNKYVTDFSHKSQKVQYTQTICLWFCCALFCYGYIISFLWLYEINIPRSFKVPPLALGQSYDCHSASGGTLKDMGKIHQ